MPKRVIDFDALWGSDKLAACAEWAQAEYAWLYGLADASGCFEITNLRVIWGRVAAIRRNLTIERLEQVFAEFRDRGLLFVWEHQGKLYAHWTGSDVPGRLPAPSWRMRLERFAPPVPKQQLAEYMARFARGRAALARAGFGGEAPAEDLERTRGRAGIKGGVERDQAQDLGLNLNLDLKWDEELDGGLSGERGGAGSGVAGDVVHFSGNSKSRVSSNSNSASNSNTKAKAGENPGLRATPGAGSSPGLGGGVSASSGTAFDCRAIEDSKGQANCNAGADANSNLSLNLNSSAVVDSHASAAAATSGAASSGADTAATDAAGYAESQLRSFSDFEWRGMSAKELATAKELRVGHGPVCGPGRVRDEILERVRRRDEEIRARSKSAGRGR